jgi:hypothetical protein
MGCAVKKERLAPVMPRDIRQVHAGQLDDRIFPVERVMQDSRRIDMTSRPNRQK